MTDFHSKLREAILQQHPFFDQDELQLGLKKFELKSCEAKELILQSGNVCDFLFYAGQSITRCYYQDDEGKEHTLWMKPEQTFLTEFKSFVGRSPKG